MRHNQPKITEDEALLNKQFDRAVKDYRLIENGDRILAAVSGGKDSLTMLSALCERQKKKRVRFFLAAANIRTDFHCGECVHRKVLTSIFDSLGIKYFFKDIKVLDEKRQTNCFWCSWNRRKTLFETAVSLKCNKVAFGHHKDDIIQTTLLNLFFQGEIASMNPRQELFKGKITIIRPLCYCNEELIKKVAQEKGFPEQLCKCPFGAFSKRKLVKDIINGLARDYADVDIKSNIYKSVKKLRYLQV